MLSWPIVERGVCTPPEEPTLYSLSLSTRDCNELMATRRHTLTKVRESCNPPFTTVFLLLVEITYNRDRKSQGNFYGANILPLAFGERRTIVNGKYFSKWSEYSVFNENDLYCFFLWIV